MPLVPLVVLGAALPSVVSFFPSSLPSCIRAQDICHHHVPPTSNSRKRPKYRQFNKCFNSYLQTLEDDTSVVMEDPNGRVKNGGGRDTPPSPKPPKKRKSQKKRPPTPRMQVFQWLNRPSVEVLSALAVLLSSFLVALDTLETLPSLSILSDQFGLPVLSDPHLLIYDVLQLINSVFFVDFFVRWYAAGNFKARYLTKPLVTLDIIVVLIPIFLGGLLPYLAAVGIAGPDGILPAIPDAKQFEPNAAGLQNLLLLRILRLRRVLTDINTFSRFEMALGLKPKDVRPYQLQLARVLLSVFTLLSVASGLIYTCEHEVNPEIPDYFAALYFGLTTLTTVGFGDIAPVTPQGRLTVCVSILAGVAIIPAQATKLVDAIVAFQQDEKKGGPRVTVRAGSAARKANEPRISSVQLREASTSGDKNLEYSEPAVEVTKSSAGEVAEDANPPTTGRFEGLLGRCCLECEAIDHREDARYCWSCGSEL